MISGFRRAIREIEECQVFQVHHSPETSLLDLRSDTLLQPKKHLTLGGRPVDDHELSEVPFPCPHAFDHTRSQRLGDLPSHSAQVAH
ncbi:hypothetical protein [Streptomyces sp. NPDC017435]|uniref:hypothetical protein n=1 Tax=Streptomyces sp. NPDC017435 TaxID=3364995 RepID=UPI00378CDE47